MQQQRNTQDASGSAARKASGAPRTKRAGARAGALRTRRARRRAQSGQLRKASRSRAPQWYGCSRPGGVQRGDRRGVVARVVQVGSRSQQCLPLRSALTPCPLQEPPPLLAPPPPPAPTHLLCRRPPCAPPPRTRCAAARHPRVWPGQTAKSSSRRSCPGSRQRPGGRAAVLEGGAAAGMWGWTAARARVQAGSTAVGARRALPGLGNALLHARVARACLPRPGAPCHHSLDRPSRLPIPTPPPKKPHRGAEASPGVCPLELGRHADARLAHKQRRARPGVCKRRGAAAGRGLGGEEAAARAQGRAPWRRRALSPSPAPSQPTRGRRPAVLLHRTGSRAAAPPPRVPWRARPPPAAPVVARVECPPR